MRWLCWALWVCLVIALARYLNKRSAKNQLLQCPPKCAASKNVQSTASPLNETIAEPALVSRKSGNGSFCRTPGMSNLHEDAVVFELFLGFPATTRNAEFRRVPFFRTCH